MTLKTKGQIYIYTPPAVFLLSIVLGNLHDPKGPQTLANNTLFALVIITFVLGLIWLLPGLIYGLQLYKYKPRATAETNTGDTKSHTLPVWVNRSFVSSIFGNSFITRILSSAVPADLTWSNSEKHLLITQASADTKLIISEVNYQDVQSISLNVNYLKLVLNHARFFIYLRDAKSDAAYAAGVFSQGSAAAGILTEVALLSKSGVKQMIDAMEAEGAYVIRPNYARAAVIGTTVFSFLFIAFVISIAVIANTN